VNGIQIIKGVFGCNLEFFQSDVDPCFLPAEKTRLSGFVQVFVA